MLHFDLQVNGERIGTFQARRTDPLGAPREERLERRSVTGA